MESVVVHALRDPATLLDRIDDAGQAGNQQQDVSRRHPCQPPLTEAFPVPIRTLN